MTKETSEDAGKAGLKEIAEWIQTLDTGGSVITLAYFFDENKDRHLSPDEFNHMLEKLGFEHLTEVGRDIFDVVDTDRDGRIDYFEFIRAINGVKSPYVEQIRKSTSPPTPIPFTFKSYSGIEVYVGENDPYSWRILIALKEIGLEYDTFVISQSERQSEVYLQKNPRGQTPTLIVDEIPIFESLAILKFLSETYPTSKLAVTLKEKSRLAKTLTRLSESEYLSKVASDARKLLTKKDEEDTKERSTIEKAVSDELIRWDEYIGAEGPYVVGKSVTLADVAIFPILAWFQHHFPSSLDEYQHLKKFYELFSGRLSVQETWPAGWR